MSYRSLPQTCAVVSGDSTRSEMATLGADDPVGQMLTAQTGLQGAEAVMRAWADGTDEVKDLLTYETDIVYECRYCRNLYRSIPNFLSHKRLYCKTLCRSSTINEVLSKQIEEIAPHILNDKGTPPQSVRKALSKGRTNIAASVQKKIQTTTFSDEQNRVDMYTLPAFSRPVPNTTMFEGKQSILRHNPAMALKERLPEDSVLLVMPQESNTAQQCGDMTLRRRKLIGVEEKELTGSELRVLDYIPRDLRSRINPATCRCRFEECAKVKPFANLFCLAYHVTVKHNRPMTLKETQEMRKGREGMFLCFLCQTTHGTIAKLFIHVAKEHDNIKTDHRIHRQKVIDALSVRAKRRLDATDGSRNRSMSPMAEDHVNGLADIEDLEGPEKEMIASSSKPKRVGKKPSKSGSSKKRSQPAPPSSSDTEKTVVDDLKELRRILEEQQWPKRKEDDESTLPESQPSAIADSQTTSGSPNETRSPSTERESIGLAHGRSKRILRKPRRLIEFATTEQEFRNVGRTLKEPSRKKMKLIAPKSEPTDSDVTSVGTEQVPEYTSSHMSPVKAKSREALTESIKRARSTVESPTKTPTKFNTKRSDFEPKSEFDADQWVTPDNRESTKQDPKKSVTPYTPNALRAKSEQGSSRRKQRLNISDDHEGDLQILTEKEGPEVESMSGKPTDLMSLQWTLSPEDEDLFFKPLKPLFKDAADGNHQCSECGMVLLSNKDGRRHMLGHIRVVRFRCALCDAGAFFCEDMRTHLMHRHCPSIHLAPESYCNGGIPCMSAKHADELTQIVHQKNPGQYLFTSGKIVTADDPKPHRPDAAIEESILGPAQPPYISPRKESRNKVPILRTGNKSPSRNLVSAENSSPVVSKIAEEEPAASSTTVRPVIKTAEIVNASNPVSEAATSESKVPPLRIKVVLGSNSSTASEASAMPSSRFVIPVPSSEERLSSVSVTTTSSPTTPSASVSAMAFNDSVSNTDAMF